MNAYEVGTDLYHRVLALDYGEERNELMRKTWEQTPWVVDAYTGSCDDYRHLEIMYWCKDTFGPECWPLHGEPGNWHRGGATVNGWTWYGFKTEGMLQEFLAAWPTPEGVTKNG